MYNVQVFSTFEIVEAGGVQISDVMGMKEDERFEAFKVDITMKKKRV